MGWHRLCGQKTCVPAPNPSCPPSASPPKEFPGSSPRYELNKGHPGRPQSPPQRLWAEEAGSCSPSLSLLPLSPRPPFLCPAHDSSAGIWCHLQGWAPAGENRLGPGPTQNGRAEIRGEGRGSVHIPPPQPRSRPGNRQKLGCLESRHEDTQSLLLLSPSSLLAAGVLLPPHPAVGMWQSLGPQRSGVRWVTKNNL